MKATDTSPPQDEGLRPAPPHLPACLMSSPPRPLEGKQNTQSGSSCRTTEHPPRRHVTPGATHTQTLASLSVTEEHTTRRKGMRWSRVSSTACPQGWALLSFHWMLWSLLGHHVTRHTGQARH